MARRKRNDGLVDTLLVLPWPVNVALGIVGFIALRWIVPSTFEGNPLLVAFAQASRSLAWVPLIFCSSIALIVFIRIKLENRAAPKIEKQSFAWRHEPNFSAEDFPAPPIKETPPSYDRLENRFFAQPELPKTWSLNALRALEWKRFELLCAKYYEATGIKATTIRCGADGGIDIKLYKDAPDKPLAIVQCKAWNTQLVGVKEVRELLGVMVHEKVSRGIFLTTGAYTNEALAFGAANPIQLLDGETFLAKIRGLMDAQQNELLAFAFDGDYKTPTCPSCGIKMIKRDSKRGPFWGCRHYPRCKRTFQMKS